MVRSVERIERDIAVLEDAVSALSVELRSAYESYLTVLGQVVQQQLILASYHLCTQGYPETFLALSFTQRQKLQQAIRKLGQRASKQLIAHLQVDNEEHTAESTSAVSNPMELAQWQQKLEQAIANTLKTFSRETNHLLQQTGISPNTLPSPVLEAAANSSEAANEVVAGPPNLLNLLVEQSDEETQDSSATHIIAIHLRLSEIEFADATVRAKRNQIRTLELRVSSLGREYHKKQRERAVAEAEAAWRASWFEE